jgi:hypothetical protein
VGCWWWWWWWWWWGVRLSHASERQLRVLTRSPCPAVTSVLYVVEPQQRQQQG